MGILDQQLRTIAALLEEADVTAAPTITCHCDGDLSIELLASDMLPLADQRSMVDRIAAALGAIPSVKPLFENQYAVVCEGYRDGLLIIASTHAGTPRPAAPQPTTASSGTVTFIHSILSWAQNVAPVIQSLVVRGTSGSHGLTVGVASAKDAEAVVAGLVPEAPRGRRLRALLPTGHPVTVWVLTT
ncbi:hypothetical protein [Streptomyces sp. NPDC020330]|uniref:hypothetical protein n=1 Tax=unclassified Streptomyces TaxID=2593676 RepID=UPI00379655C5